MVNAMLGVLPENSRLRFELTATRMEVQLIGNQGDGSLRDGLHLTNSEVGAASVSLSAPDLPRHLPERADHGPRQLPPGASATSEQQTCNTPSNEQVPYLIEASAEARTSFKGTTGVVVKDHEKAFERIVERYQLTKQQLQRHHPGLRGRAGREPLPTSSTPSPAPATTLNWPSNPAGSCRKSAAGCSHSQAKAGAGSIDVSYTSQIIAGATNPCRPRAATFISMSNPMGADFLFAPLHRARRAR
ncbi:MAG: hypothetical protein M5U25_16250 [Planctomycetota bacterium]|nr:hypothetical protein [Planctomycetota bacterium]